MKFTALEDFAQKPLFFNIWGRTGYTENGSVRLNPLVLFWTASGIEIAVRTEKCREVYADIECSWKHYRPYLSIWINGKRVRRLAPEKGRTRLLLWDSAASDTGAVDTGAAALQDTVAAAQSNEQEKIVCIRILKECQAMAGDSSHRLAIHGFFHDVSGTGLSAIGVCAANESAVFEHAFENLFAPVQKRPLLFECIGDSITCGEGLEEPIDGKDWNPAWQGTRNHFAMLLSERFNADISVLAQSGWGLLCGWNNDPACVIPPLYPFVCALAKGGANREAGARQSWSFSRRKTDAVIVNLGSNDEYAFRAVPWEDPASGKTYKLQGEADYERLKKEAKTFIGEIRCRNPDALIIWCYGMFLTGCMDLFRSAVEDFRTENGDDKVRFIELSPMDDRTAGAQKHPGPLCHKEAADLISKVLKEYGFGEV